MPERITLDQEPIWEIQFDETVTQYRAFCLYRDLGPGRSLAKVQAAWYRPQSGHKPATKNPPKKGIAGEMKNWSVKNRWVERADAYWLEKEREWREERETEIARMQRTEATLGRTLVSAALRKVIGDTSGDTRIDPLDVNALTAGEVAQIARVGVDISRLSTNRHTSLVKGVLMISQADYEKTMSDVIEIFMGHIDDVRKPLAAEEFRAYISGERRMLTR